MLFFKSTIPGDPIKMHYIRNVMHLSVLTEVYDLGHGQSIDRLPYKAAFCRD